MPLEETVKEFYRYIKNQDNGDKIWSSILIGYNTFSSGAVFAIRNKDNPKVSYDITGGKINTTDADLANTYFLRCFDAIQRCLDSNIKDIDRNKSIIATEQKKLIFSFEKEDELNELKEVSANLENKLSVR